MTSLLSSYASTGSTASKIASGASLLASLCVPRLSPSFKASESDPLIYFSCTSNLISSGLRESIVYLCKHKLIDVLVTTGGGLEEDLMKVFRDTYCIEYLNNDRAMHDDRLFRNGNMMIPEENYDVFEGWFADVVQECEKEQEELGTVWTPSGMMQRMGEKINCEESIYYWCAKNGIKVFNPGFVDGTLGEALMLGYDDGHLKNFRLDVNQDITDIVNICKGQGRPTAIISLGGGLPKYHVNKAVSIGTGGADKALYVNHANEHDFTYSGAKPSQDYNNGGLKENAETVYVNGEASIIFTLMCAIAFGKDE